MNPAKGTPMRPAPIQPIDGKDVICALRLDRRPQSTRAGDRARRWTLPLEFVLHVDALAQQLFERLTGRRLE
jgi:hypothetical protein